MKTLGDIGEPAALERVLGLLPSRADVLVGAGDDCAVVGGGETFDWLLTADPVIEGVHFDPGADPAAIGHKAVGRVLSDVAAMGGDPCWVLLDIAAPARTPVTVLDGFYSGACRLAAAAGAAIAGGDMSRSPILSIHAFGVGRVPTGRAVLRSGARPGEAVYVTGALGGSRLGRHLAFEPRVAEGRWLRDWADAMTDVSDGLATDLRHLAAASGVGIRLDTARLPVSKDASRCDDGRTALDHALADGEDFELLFTVPAGRGSALEAAWRKQFTTPLTGIGSTTADAGVILTVDSAGRAAPLAHTGHSHWSTP